MDTIKEYWRTWLWRDAVTKIITINFIVWLVLSCFIQFGSVGTANTLLSYFVLPGTFSELRYRVLTLFTYMFTQTDFLHMLCNMLWFLLFGNLFMQTQSGKRLAILYVYGGLAAALTFLLVNTSHGYMYGSSCAVLAIIGGATLILPQWRVNLFIFGPVKVLWLAIAAVIFFVVLSTNLEQSLAHTAGLLTGIVYALLRKRGVDITQPVAEAIDAIMSRRRPTAKPIKSPGSKYSRREEQEFDDLLAKVGRSGYSSLTAYERQRLFDLSQKIKR